jgi:hypothetical protein
MAARMRKLRSDAKGPRLLELLTMEARALQCAAHQLEYLTSHRVSLMANLMADLSAECHRGIECMQSAQEATTIEEARLILSRYLKSIDREL